MSTELFEAIEQHDVYRFATLLDRGANPNVAVSEQPTWTPLKAAIEELTEQGPVASLVLLLRHGATVTASSIPGDATPLLVAVFCRQPEATRLLLAAGADPNVRDAEGDSPLRLAVSQGDSATVSLLLQCGATGSINDSGGPNGRNALGIATSTLNIPMIELLLRFGADSDSLDSDNQSARHHLPARDSVNAHLWDTAFRMLQRQA